MGGEVVLPMVMMAMNCEVKNKSAVKKMVDIIGIMLCSWAVAITALATSLMLSFFYNFDLKESPLSEVTLVSMLFLLVPIFVGTPLLFENFIKSFEDPKGV